MYLVELKFDSYYCYYSLVVVVDAIRRLDVGVVCVTVVIAVVSVDVVVAVVQ